MTINTKFLALSAMALALGDGSRALALDTSLRDDIPIPPRPPKQPEQEAQTRHVRRNLMGLPHQGAKEMARRVRQMAKAEP